nr:hypothetical protein [Tanacetum cinerariifolium]
RNDDKDDEEEGGDDDQEYDEETRNGEIFDPILKTPKNSDDEGNGNEDLGLNVGGEEEHVEEEEEDKLYRDVNINQGRGIQETLEVEDSHVTLTLVNPDGMKSIFETTSQMDTQTPTSMAPLPMTATTMTPSTIATITTTSQAPILPTTRMNEAVKVAVQMQSDHLREEAQIENDEFLKTTVNEQLEAEVLTRSSHSSRTSYAVAVDLSEMELKKILIEKMEGNKESVTLKRHHDNDADKDEEPSVGPDRGSMRRREGKEPESASALENESALEEEPMQTASQMEEPSHLEFNTGAEDQPIVQSSQHAEWFSQQQKPPSPDRDWNKTVPAVHKSIQPWISKLAKQIDSRSSFNELMDTPLDFSNFLINRIKVDTLTPKILDGPTYELMKGSCKSLVELEYHLEEVFKATTDQLEWVNPEVGVREKELSCLMKGSCKSLVELEYHLEEVFKATTDQLEWVNPEADYRHIKWIEDLVPRIIWIKEPIGYDKHALWGITVRRDDDKLYKFKEGDFKRLRIQDIKDMLLLLVQGKLTNLTVEECFAFNVSLRMFTRSIVIQRRMEDLQLGVESYQKKLNLTKPDSYRSDLKRKEAYTAYSNPRGFIYQNKDKKNCDETLIDVHTALDDRLKWIRMQYLPQSIWRKSDKDRAATMILAIDKRLKTKRIMRRLEMFVGRRLSILTNLQVTLTKPGRMTKPYSSHYFIANCFNAGNLKMEVKHSFPLNLSFVCVRLHFPHGGFPDVIHGSVVASRPKTMQEATEMENELMDKRNNTLAECQAENKRKFDDTSRNNQSKQQQQNKRQNTSRAYTAESGEKKPYGGSKPLCPKCNYHYDGPCASKCHKCNKVVHFSSDCRSTENVNTANNQRGNEMGQKPTCYECGAQWNFKKDCPKLKINNRGTQGRNATAPAKVYAVGRAGTNPDLNVVTGTFLLNNRYAFILFDTGSDRSFMSTAFSSQIAITPTTLDHYYDVELAEGRIIGLNSILRACTLNFLNQPFNIDLMPIELGSFDAIISMDWLAKYRAVIVCA